MNIFRRRLCRSCSRSFPAAYYSEFVCPACARTSIAGMLRERLAKQHFFGSSPAPFVGRFGYPLVNVGILSPGVVSDDAWMYDAPEFWSSSNLQIPQIVDYRASLVNSRAKSQVKSGSRYLDLARDVAMASKPVDVEVSFKRKPAIGLSFSEFTAPSGPAVELESASLASNPRVHAKVEKVFSDTDLRAAEAVSYLYRSSFDVNFLSKILSVGTLGLQPDRRLVPTRFAITATDDMIGKQLIAGVKDFQEIGSHLAFFGGYLGNYYLVMLFPDVWSYELFEAYARADDFSTDYESYAGRKTYAESCAGGYYAARLGVLELLKSMKRQASVLVVRMITDEYQLPLGVWVVREAVRKAAAEKPIEFSSGDLMLKYADAVVSRKFGYAHFSRILSSSLLLRSRSQMKLGGFF
ncbi:hypothetical protein HYY74_04070 [Candidatus Woesearchaeota archaeon]|nr:hypothetical protein [Candidatus Woesearchaeota archaeon]